MKVFALIAALSLVLVGCNQAALQASPTPETSPVASALDQAGDAAQDVVGDIDNIKTITLVSQSNSGQTGTAVIAPTDDNKVQVTLNLKGGNFTQPQPAHIHVGTCDQPGNVVYPLNNVVNGSSDTTINVDYDTALQANAQLLINVHKSAAESNVYTACGEIK